jgi:hypothetical protein
MEPDYTALAEADIAAASSHPADLAAAAFYAARARAYAMLAVAQAIRAQTTWGAMDATDRADLDAYREQHALRESGEEPF